VRPRRDSALRDDHTIVRSRHDELERRCAVDVERVEVARVDSDDLRPELDGPTQLRGVVRLDEDVEAEFLRP
jgi:hypothetical protein